MFLALNGQSLEVATGDAVELMLAVAAGERDEDAVKRWLDERIEPRHSSD